MHEADCAVIGAGVIGLAIARTLAQRGLDTILIERETAIGTQISARNSEVIHAGIYYPQGSLKAAASVEGRQRLYAYCAARGIPHRRCGKIVAATSTDQRARLEQLFAAGQANGVDDLQLIDGAAARNLEPELHAVAAILSPSTGIVDAQSLMASVWADFSNAGGLTALRNEVVRIAAGPHGLSLWIAGDDAPALRVRHVVNAAGLGAVALAAAVRDLDPAHIPPLHLAKGSYFVLSGKSPFTRLIYPLPEPGGLGTHLTLDLAGAARFGPDVEWVEEADYRVDPARAAPFYRAVRAFWPGLPDDALIPGHAGIRPKIAGPGQPPADFLISGPEQHGIPGLINLFGIESPGLTASLALAETIAARLED